MKQYWVILFFLSFILINSTTTDNYVDPVSGSDTNSGSTPGDAFKTIT